LLSCEININVVNAKVKYLDKFVSKIETKVGVSEIFDIIPNNNYSVVEVKVDSNDDHSGGDVGIMRDLCNYLCGDRTSISITSISDSVNGHLCVYAAEKSRKCESIVDLKKEYKKI